MSIASDFITAHPDLERVEVLLPDLSGILRGKSLPANELSKVMSGDALLPRGTVLLDTLGDACLTTPYGYLDGDPDRPLLPIASTLTMVPWAKRPTAQVLAVVADEPDTPWFANPREVLRHSMDSLHNRGFYPTVAVELEFHLLRRGESQPTAAVSADGWPAYAGPQTYNLEHAADFDNFLVDVERYCDIQGVAMSSALSEFGEGQFEINLHHTSDVLKAADDALLLRRIVRQCARQHGLIASFMAKPLMGNSGNGMHAHVSLGDALGENCFASSDNGELPKLLRECVAGLLTVMPTTMAFLAPNANSYRRFEPESFAPMVADWGLDHRGVAIRIPHARGAGTRFEHRVAGADANPYLVLASILAGVTCGLQLGLEPPSAHVGPPITQAPSHDSPARLPNRWCTALDTLQHAIAQQDLLVQTLGQTYCELYLEVKRYEENVLHQQLTQYDYLNYLRIL